MKSETQTEQPVSSDEETKPEDAVVQPTTRRVAYKTVLVAVVIGIITISLLWGFVIGQEGSPVYETSIMKLDAQVHEGTVTKELPAAKPDPVVESINRWLVSMTSRINRGFDTQQAHSSVVKGEISAMTESIQAIKMGIANMNKSNQKLGERISEAISRLDTFVKNVRALKVVRRKPSTKRKSRPINKPPFHIDVIDVWDDVIYVSVSQAGRVAFLKAGEQQSGWTVSKIDRLKGQVDFQRPAGHAYSVSLQR
ncbi:hypothetical protein [Candidatus Vondammii sp. HM_W22]|uniref:hypothetical protein n=1 Tax=Candidatus Vondammii sp. HM_W22 TaxID=2687299 RepID=UPI001F1330A3|nr:hypothetical protein [Candidatus Vondammii sp. HM_W22]